MGGTDAAHAVVAGEMIQHYCGDDTGSCGPLKKAKVTPPPTFAAPPPTPSMTPAPTPAECSGWIFCLPTWAVVLLSISILLVCGALTGAGVMYFKNRQRRKGRGYAVDSGTDQDEYGSDY